MELTQYSLGHIKSIRLDRNLGNVTEISAIGGKPVDHFDDQQQGILQYLAAILFVLLIALGLLVGLRYPLAGRWLSSTMIVAGLAVFFSCMLAFGRYSKVYDYEQTSFRGRPATGKQVREMLRNIGLGGGGLSAVGLTLLVFSSFS